MRQSYRDKQSRKARINREKEEKNIEKKNKQKYNNDIKYGRSQKTIKSKEKDFNSEEKTYEDVVAGRNAVLELLKSDRDINKLYIERGEKHGSPFNYADVDDILDLAEQKGEDPFIIILDGIEDVHNLGAIIRTAETAGCHGVIIPKRRSVQVNATVSKVSAGATSYVKVARVNNLNETIKYLKEKGLWVIGTDGEADKFYYDQDLKGPLAIIIGSEGFGMSRLTKENVDILVKIPMFGKITSLNASVSSGIVIYEVVKQRIK